MRVPLPKLPNALRPKRRWFQYSLRTLLLLMTLFAVWMGWYVHRARVQKQSVAAIRQYGGWVRYDFQFPTGRYSYKDFDAKARSPVPRWLLGRLGVDFFHNVVQVNLNYTNDGGGRQENHNPSDEALQYLTGFPNLRVLLLSDTQASDASMRYLARLKRLERLMMWDASEVSDAGVMHLSDLKNLKYIHLTKSQITDSSLKVFADMPQLEGLCLQFNYFTDEGMRHVSQSPRLEELWVCGRDLRRNPITNVGLARLEKLEKLKELGVQYTQVTAEGIRSFKNAVPACRIVVN